MNVDLGDVTIAVDEWGEGDPFVLLHGYTGSAQDFAAVAPRLATGRRVLAHTHRGHGASTNTGDPSTYTFAQIENDVTRTLDALGLDQVDLLGHSMGGIVAMRFVLANPGRVRSLVLMDTAAAPASEEQPEMLAGIADIACDQGMAALWDQVGEMWSSFASTEENKAALEEAILALDPFAFRELGRELFDYPSMLDGLGKLHCPVTVIVGENDTSLRAAADDLAKTIPDATLEVISDAGHSPQVDKPDEWVAVVLSHLKRARA